MIEKRLSDIGRFAQMISRYSMTSRPNVPNLENVSPEITVGEVLKKAQDDLAQARRGIIDVSEEEAYRNRPEARRLETLNVAIEFLEIAQRKVRALKGLDLAKKICEVRQDFEDNFSKNLGAEADRLLAELKELYK